MYRPPRAPGANRRRRFPRPGEAVAKSARCRVRLAASSARGSAVGDRRRQEAGLSRPVRWSRSSIRRPTGSNTAPAGNRSVSPVLRMRSTRQSSSLRHQTRNLLVSPRRSARLANDSLTGVEVARALDKARPRNPTGTFNTLGERDGRSLGRPGRTCIDYQWCDDERGGRAEHDQPTRVHGCHCRSLN